MVFDVSQHSLVPKHVKASDSELKELLERHSLTLNLLPKIILGDPSIAGLSVKEGDVVKVVRDSRTAGQSFYFRRVAHA